MKKIELKKLIRESIEEFFNKKPQTLEETNQCKQEGFCCRNRNTRKQTDATSEKGVCSCPKGSSKVNCPR